MADRAQAADLPAGPDAAHFGDDAFLTRLRQFNLALFLALPLAILVMRAAADAIVVIIALSFLVACARSRYWAWMREPPVAIAFVLWAVANVIVSPFAMDVGDSFGRSLPWIRFVLFYAAVTMWLVTGERELRLVGWWMAAVIALFATDALAQHLTGVSLSGNEIAGRRLTGILDRPNLGILLAKFGFPTLALLAWFCARGARRVVVAASVAVGLLIFVTIFLTGERAATLLSLIGLSIALAWVFAMVPRLRLAATTVFFGLAGVLAAVIALEERLQVRALRLADELSNFGGSSYGELFTVAFRAFADHPLTGVGLRSFRLACPEYASLGYIRRCLAHPHNIYLEWLSEGGAIAFAVFVAFVVALFVALWRLIRRDGVDAVSGGLLAGALLVSFFPFTASQSFLSNWPAVLLWFSVALAMASAGVMARGRPGAGSRT